ncbi:hypothetical protein CRUP_027149 [Coryphaenoides rupestris]|nr:hypothetical protein CRUP_027149 [Coryphaenoides rupestris]
MTAKCATVPLLLLCFLLQVADSYPKTGMPRMGCDECSLKKSNLSWGEHPVYQCMGCCFSRAYPTSQMSKETMIVRKNITSEASCCVAAEWTLTQVILDGNTELVKNQTLCHCSSCHYHKQ